MTFETANKAAIVTAVSSPWWLPILKNASDVAGLVLPILGVLWLVLQIVIKLYQVRRNK